MEIADEQDKNKHNLFNINKLSIYYKKAY